MPLASYYVFIRRGCLSMVSCLFGLFRILTRDGIGVADVTVCSETRVVPFCSITIVKPKVRLTEVSEANVVHIHVVSVSGRLNKSLGNAEIVCLLEGMFTSVGVSHGTNLKTIVSAQPIVGWGCVLSRER